MIAALSGKVIHRDLTWLILEVGGVGYQVFTPAQLVAAVGQDLRLFCSHQVREDSQTLYGFATLAERSLFELLLTVSGVGPKSALSIVSSRPVDQVLTAIETTDISLFEAAPGIGKKVAARIIVELRGKIVDTAPGAGPEADLIVALESLGYRRAEITPLLRQLPADLADTAARVRWVLRELAKV